MSTKEIRHQKAQEFKNEIASVTNRNRKIQELTQNVSNLSEIDRLKITILFQKKDFVSGCELAFEELIKKIQLTGDTKLKATALTFASKTGLRLKAN